MPFPLGDPATTIAVVGATDNPAKYGSRIYRDLRAKGYRVFAVNPSRETVHGDPSYPSLEAIGERPTIVDIVVPPAVTLQVLDECERLELHNVWVQPGAEDGAVMDRLDQGDFDYRAGGPCIMVESAAVS